MVRGGTYDDRGYNTKCAVAPSLFLVPLACFNPAPKPCEFIKGQKVLVRVIGSHRFKRRYFSHIDNAGRFCCYDSGADEWSSGGDISRWAHCKAWVDVNMKRS